MTEVTTKLTKHNMKQIVAWGLAIVMCFSLFKLGTFSVEGSTLLGEFTQYCVTSGDGTTRGDGKLAHHYNSTPVFNWAEDGKTCTATFTCDFKDGQTTVDCTVTSRVKLEATCKDYGVTEYVASVIMSGKSYLATKDIADIAPHHEFVTTINKATPKADGAVITTCSVCGWAPQTPILMPKKLVLDKTSYTYDGKAKEPSVTIKDYKGEAIDSSNYAVVYTNNKSVGTAIVTVVFVGDYYSGTMTKTFTIQPAQTTIAKATSKTAQTATITWKKQSKQVSGYQIRYSTSSKMTSAKKIDVQGASKTNTTINKLTSGKKYYIQVRTYKSVDGNRTYSSWSTAKSVTIK